MVPFGDLSGHINDLTSKKISLTASQNLIAKKFGQQPVKLKFSPFLKIPLSPPLKKGDFKGTPLKLMTLIRPLHLAKIFFIVKDYERS